MAEPQRGGQPACITERVVALEHEHHVGVAQESVVPGEAVLGERKRRSLVEQLLDLAALALADICNDCNLMCHVDSLSSTGACPTGRRSASAATRHRRCGEPANRH